MAEHVAQVGAVGRARARARSGSACPQYGHSKSAYSTSVTGASSPPRTWSRSGSTGSERSTIRRREAPAPASLLRQARDDHLEDQDQLSSGRDDRRAEDPELRFLEPLAGRRTRSAMSNATVKPIPATVAAPTSGGQATVKGKPTEPAAAPEPRRGRDPDELPDDEPDDDPDRDRRRRGRARAPRDRGRCPRSPARRRGTMT